MMPSGPTTQTQLGSTQRDMGSAAADGMSYGDGEYGSDREQSVALEMEVPITQPTLNPWQPPNPPPPTKTEPVARTQRPRAAQSSDQRFDRLLSRMDRLERALSKLAASKTPPPTAQPQTQNANLPPPRPQLRPGGGQTSPTLADLITSPATTRKRYD